MKKVAFKYWPREASNDHFFKNILKENFDVHITSKKEADVLFFSTFDGSNTKTIPKIDFEGTKVFWTGENIPFYEKYLCKSRDTPSTEMNSSSFGLCDYGFGFDYEETIKSKNYLRLPLYVYYGAGNDLIKPKNYNPRKILNSKTKFCNYIYSKDAKKRVELFKELDKYKRVDAPGKSMNNCAPMLPSKLTNVAKLVQKAEAIRGKYPISSLLSRHFGNWREAVINYQKDYKFSIAFENSERSGYTTEKIYHPMLANSIPIYFGNPEISKDFNTKSFVNFYDYNDIKKLADVIIDIDQNDKKYLRILKEPWLKKNKLNKWMDQNKIKKQLGMILNE
jgi:hypothetical protein